MDKLIEALDASMQPGAVGQPKEHGLAQKYSNQGKITTLMLRNIPTQYSQDMLLEELTDCMGSSDCFNFFYLPWDQKEDCNMGYAFVNFCTTAAVERCSRIFTNFSFRQFDSHKVCKVYPAHIQGLENNVLHLMDRAVSEARSHYPIIMWKGQKLKLGKVIAALDSRQRVPPASAPAKSAAPGAAPVGGPRHQWPPQEDLDTQGAERAFAQTLNQHRGQRDDQQSGGFRPGHAKRAPNPTQTKEMCLLEAMPNLRQALNQQRQAVRDSITESIINNNSNSPVPVSLNSGHTMAVAPMSMPCRPSEMDGGRGHLPSALPNFLCGVLNAEQGSTVIGDDAVGGCHTIEIRSADQMVLNKFFSKFGP